MNEEIAQKIRQISEIDFPDGLHGKIMRKLAFLQFRTPFLVVVSLLTLNLLFSGWNIWIKLAGTESFLTFKLLLEGFEWNTASISDLIYAAQGIFPLGLMFSFAINILLVGYLLYVLKTYKTLAPKNTN